MIYNVTGDAVLSPSDVQGDATQKAYNLSGDLVYGGKQYPFEPRPVVYDLNIINDAWLINATAQRDAVLEKYNQSDDAIPFFIETDAHGNKNEGNKGCQNLAEPTMGFITNIQLGDWGSFYSNGENAEEHYWTSFGLINYIPVIGNHELLANNSTDAPIADMSVLINSFTPYHGILGSSIYGYYKVMDVRYHVKYLVFQGHIPVDKSVDSSGFIFKMTGEQWEWAIEEMSANDGFDIVIINHEPFNGVYYSRTFERVVNYYPSTGDKINLAPLLTARKAKQRGSIADSDGVEHSYDFTNCTTRLLCALHGHRHYEEYSSKEFFGFPTYTCNLFDTTGNCAYGLIDRSNNKLYIYSFNKNATNSVLELDL